MGSCGEVYCCCVCCDCVSYLSVDSTTVSPASLPLFRSLSLSVNLFLLLFRSWRLLYSPSRAIPALMMRFLRTTTFITMAVGTSWTSICLFQHLLPASFLPTQRFYLSGLLGGLWAFVDRKKGRGRFLYSTRLSIESAWKVAVKHRYVKPIKYPLFISSLVSPPSFYSYLACVDWGQGWRRHFIGIIAWRAHDHIRKIPRLNYRRDSPQDYVVD